MTQAHVAHFLPAADGLELHYREYLPAGGMAHPLPVVCLPGLTRGAADFDVLARRLASSSTPRRVLAIDYRGRGQSGYAEDWRRYDLDTERDDLFAVLRHAAVTSAQFIGTSRGGLHLMALAQQHRHLIRAVVLNDIGPVLEREGLARIKSYVGVPASPRTAAEAVAILKIGAGLHFDGLTEAEWLHFAATTFGDPPDLRQRYDLRLARTLDGLDLSKPLPDLWAQYDALSGLPVLVVRGANSDLLSAETFATMMTRWPNCRGLVVAGQGHAPLLADERTLGQIADFLVDTSEVPPG